MNLRQLQCFLAVAEERHFTRAADRLHIEQSPPSRTIRDLEHNLGVTLFERGTGIGTRLTPAGKALAESAPRIFTLVDQARSSTQAAAAGSLATLRIALSDGILPKRLAALLASASTVIPCSSRISAACAMLCNFCCRRFLPCSMAGWVGIRSSGWPYCAKPLNAPGTSI